MDAETYHFHIGNIECLAINDGTFAYHNPAELFFTNATGEQLAPALLTYGIIQYEWKEYLSPFTCLLVRTRSNTVLIDTGAGKGPVAGLGNLPDLMQKEGIPPEAVDTVLITHGHPDHLGGNTDPEGGVVFPNARFLISKSEWEYWSSDDVLANGGFFAQMVRKNMLAIQDRFSVVEPDLEVCPGILATAAEGHTPGHMMVSIHSRGRRLLVVSDAFLQPLHVEQPAWYSKVDIQPEVMVNTRRELIKKAAREQALVLAFHFPFPGLGNIIQKDDGYCWEPLC